MKALRWIVCVPLAMVASVLMWVGVRVILPSASFGGGLPLIENILGLLPLSLASILANVAFALVGVLTAPTADKSVAFIFCGLTFCLSAGGFGIVIYRQDGFEAFFLTSSISYFVGVGVGLVATLRLQRRRREKLTTSNMLTPPPAAS